MQIRIKKDPRHPETHRVALVEVRGRVYACTYAEPWPSEADVREDWDTYGRRHPTKGFRPYDESERVYHA